MAPSLLDTFRILSSFETVRLSLRGAPWDAYVEWAISQGLAPLAAYNLEYRLGGADAPEWVRDRLLSVYQGSLNDNVMKLVQFKRTIDALEGCRILLLGGACFVEALYPHVAFRPLLQIRMLLREEDMDRATAAFSAGSFKSAPGSSAAQSSSRVLSDGRTELVLACSMLGEKRVAAENAIFDRALPMKVYGPSIFRPGLEDAILLVCLAHARSGYQVPMLSFIDLRELLLGAPAVSGPYSHPFDAVALKGRAADWRIERALFASASIVEKLFPASTVAVQQALPPLRAPSRRLLERGIVAPVVDLGKTRALRGAQRWTRLLVGEGLKVF